MKMFQGTQRQLFWLQKYLSMMQLENKFSLKIFCADTDCRGVFLIVFIFYYRWFK